MLHTGTPEERIWFTEEERKEIHKENYGICAHCGKKLTVREMTVEHIIPRSRGGKNERENLCCLCKTCNEEKGSVFFLPNGYYHALIGTPRYRRMVDYTYDWYQKLPEEQKADLIRFPLITPIVTATVAPIRSDGYQLRRHKKTPGMIRTAMVEWHIVGNELRDEVEAVTGISIREARSFVCEGKDPNNQAGAYILKKVTTDKLLCLAVARYFEEQSYACIYIPWADTSKAYLSAYVFNFVKNFLQTIVHVAGKPLREYSIIAKQPGALDSFTQVQSMDSDIGIAFSSGQWKTEEEELMYEIRIQRGRRIDEIFDAAQEVIRKEKKKNKKTAL